MQTNGIDAFDQSVWVVCLNVRDTRVVQAAAGDSRSTLSDWFHLVYPIPYTQCSELANRSNRSFKAVSLQKPRHTPRAPFPAPDLVKPLGTDPISWPDQDSSLDRGFNGRCCRTILIWGPSLWQPHKSLATHRRTARPPRKKLKALGILKGGGGAGF